jgi:hypothetical protein
MLIELTPADRSRGWKEAPGANAAAEATNAEKATNLADMTLSG